MAKNGTRNALSSWLKTLRKPALAPASVFGVHIGLRRLGIYDRFLQLDAPMHFFGGVAMAWFVHRALGSASVIGLLPTCSSVTHRLLVFSVTCTIAVFWEFSEFALDWRSGSDLQRGVLDTMADLFLGLAGALLVTLLPAGRSPRRATS